MNLIRLAQWPKDAWGRLCDLVSALLDSWEAPQLDYDPPDPRETSKALAWDIAMTYYLGEAAYDRIQSRIYKYGLRVSEDAEALVELLAKPEAVTDKDRKAFAGKIGDLRKIIAHFVSETENLREDLGEADTLHVQMASILNRVAEALHGGPRPDGGCWNWEDLEQIALEMRAKAEWRASR